MPLAMSQEHGHNLQTVQMLLKKNQVTDSSTDKKETCLFLCFFKILIRICFFCSRAQQGTDVMQTACSDEDSTNNIET